MIILQMIRRLIILMIIILQVDHFDNDHFACGQKIAFELHFITYVKNTHEA